jgi:hypothetical protein
MRGEHKHGEVNSPSSANICLCPCWGKQYISIVINNSEQVTVRVNLHMNLTPNIWILEKLSATYFRDPVHFREARSGIIHPQPTVSFYTLLIPQFFMNLARNSKLHVLSVAKSSWNDKWMYMFRNKRVEY